MFIGRKEEQRKLISEFDPDKKSAILIYGKRRVGKSTLICHSAKNFDGIIINHQCIKSSYSGNLEYLSKSVVDALGLPNISFGNLYDVFDFLGRQSQRVLLIIDEYQYIKASLKSGEMDSIMQAAIDRMSHNITLILCGSYISVMKELLTESNPLFGRFTTIIHLKEMNYLEASEFMDGYTDREKAMAYSVFGGSPYVLSNLEYKISVEDNIKKYLLPENSILATYIENVALSEIRNTFDIRILEIIGNGKKKYSEILMALDLKDNGYLDKQLSYLLQMETIKKVVPFNKVNDKKKTFYEINDNLMRFYFAMVFGNTGRIMIIGAQNYFEEYISSKLIAFVSLRFEDIVIQYFMNLAKNGQLKGIRTIGTYWYDDPVSKRNGQFDCALEFEDCLKFYEVKFYDKPMTKLERKKERAQVASIPGLENVEVGFVCSGGFEDCEKDGRENCLGLEDLFFGESDL